MAHIVRLDVLVDESSENVVYDSLNEILNAAKHAENGNVLDWSIEGAYATNDAVDDSICNDTYEEGDAFKAWVIYSASEAARSDDKAGFWSNKYGWTTYDLASSFPANRTNKPMTVGNDAIFVLAREAQKLL